MPTLELDRPWVAVGLYVASLVLPAFTTTTGWIGTGIVDEVSTWAGWMVLLIGWAGILDSAIAWYANPLFLIALVLYLRQKSRSFHFSLAALAVAMTAPLYRDIFNDGGPPERISSYGLGFCFWLLSFAFLAWSAWSRKDEFTNKEMVASSPGREKVRIQLREKR